MAVEGRTRLTSWKEIATHLRREVRTVIRWEKERGLPVHRIPGGQGRSVFAYTDELDRWAAGELEPPRTPAIDPTATPPRMDARPWLRLARGFAAVLILTAVTAGAVIAWPRPDISDVRVDTGSLTALGANRPLWTFQFPHSVALSTTKMTAVADLDADGRGDVVAGVNVIASEDTEPAARLYALDSRGTLIWQKTVDDALNFGSGPFGAPWQSDDVRTFSDHGQPRIAWTLHHFTWWPSLLAVFDGHGNRLGTFVNAGWMRTTRATPDGRYLIAAGFSNSRDAAAFAILDSDHPSGTSPEDAGSPYACKNCPAGAPARYITVEWTDVAAPLAQDERNATLIVSPNGTVQLHAQQRRNTEAIVELSPSMDVVRATFSDNFWEVHERLQREGTLTHARDRCPFRNGPIVREWTPAGGWRAVPALVVP